MVQFYHLLILAGLAGLGLSALWIAALAMSVAPSQESAGGLPWLLGGSLLSIIVGAVWWIV